MIIYMSEQLKTIRLYKYRNINENTMKILTKGELYFSSPSDFNDPFECQIPINLKITEKELSKVLKKGKNNFIKKEKLMNVLNVQFNGNKSEYVKYLNKNEIKIQKDLEERKNYFKIYCLSKSYDKILMWSHYADSHKGICIGFNFYKIYNKQTYMLINKTINDIDTILEIIKVKYSKNKLKKVRRINFNDNNLKKGLTTKASFWNYEEEYRIILGEHSLFYISPEIIKELIFGLQTSDSDIRKTLQEIHDSDFLKLSDLNIYKIIKSETSFTIKKEFLDYKKYIESESPINKTLYFINKKENYVEFIRKQIIYYSNKIYKKGDYILDNQICYVVEGDLCKNLNGKFTKDNSYTKRYFRARLENNSEFYYFYINK